jgi:hypothetical protein
VKALTLWEPWASAMAWGLKRVETRSWGTSFRGPMAITAAKRDTEEEREWLIEMTRRHRENFSAFTDFSGDNESGRHRLGFGRALCWGNLVNCVRIGPRFREGISQLEHDWGDYSDGRYAWVFDNVMTHPVGIPVRGFQQIWNLPEPIAEQLVRESVEDFTDVFVLRKSEDPR